jgi:hypothetical protein
MFRGLFLKGRARTRPSPINKDFHSLLEVSGTVWVTTIAIKLNYVTRARASGAAVLAVSGCRTTTGWVFALVFLFVCHFSS